MKLNDLYFESLISLIFVFVAGCAGSRVVKRVYDFEEGTMPNWIQVLPIASDTLEGPAHTFENGLLNMKTHAKHATLMVYNQQDIKDCAIEAKIMWRTFYLDGEKVGETENDLFKRGQLAVYTVSSAEASFDDVIIIYSVDGK